MTEKPRSLAVKLHAVMQKAKYLQKKGWNSAQNYKYVQEADLIDLVKPLLEEEGIVTIPQYEFEADHDHVKGEGASAKFSYRTTLKLSLVFMNIDDPKDILTVTTLGEGWDQQDKAAYKAMTGALKYALAKTFLIPTGEDPEVDEPGEKKKEPPPPPAEPPKAKPLDEVKLKKVLGEHRERLGPERYLEIMAGYATEHAVGSTNFDKWPEEHKRGFYRLVKETTK